MRFERLYRASVYFTLVLATLVLSIDRAQENRLAMLFPPLVAIAGFVAMWTVDRDPRLGLSPQLANPLALIALGLAYLEFQSDPNELVLPLGHLLVYLQLIKIFQVKRVEDDWYLLLLALVQIVVGGYLSQSDTVGLILLIWVLASLWSLLLGHLHRESLRAETSATGDAARTDSARRPEPYPGLITPSFLASSVGVGVTTILLGGLIFLLMPRRADSRSGPRTTGTQQHLSGFSEEVRLGQLGEILENHAIVMTVTGNDGQGDRLRITEDTLWRGIAPERYAQKKWSRTSRSRGRSTEIATFGEPFDEQSIRRYRVRMEPTDNTVLFAIRPVLQAVGSRRGNQPEISVLDGTLYRSQADSAAYEYDFWTDVREGIPQRGESFPSPDRLRTLTEVGQRLPGREDRSPREATLRQIAERALAAARVPRDDQVAVARTLEAHLRDSGIYQYTLKQETSDARIDPVEDFLLNRRRGHCEYFASALALLLRSLGIPTRLINGFKGGDWNELTGAMTVRQKHAHSWVEALVSTSDDKPVWITLDPTPAAAREETLRRVGGLGTSFRLLGDMVRQIWFFYVIGFNAERQERLLYRPIRELLLEARRGYATMVEAVKDLFTGLFHFQDISSVFSVRGSLAAILLMLAMVGLWRLVWRIVRWLRRRIAGPEDDGAAWKVGTAFYRRLVQILEQAGLRRNVAETPQEFADRAARTLTTASEPRLEAVAATPRSVVGWYYRVRYGRLEIAPETARELEERIDQFEGALRKARSAGG